MCHRDRQGILKLCLALLLCTLSICVVSCGPASSAPASSLAQASTSPAPVPTAAPPATAQPLPPPTLTQEKDYVVKRENADYYFVSQPAQGWEQQIEYYESLLGELKEQYKLPIAHTKTCFGSKTQRMAAHIYIRDGAYIDTKDIMTKDPVVLAAYIQQSMDGEYPVWISMGLAQRYLKEKGLWQGTLPERSAAAQYVKDKAGLLPPFGDAWAIPGFLGENEAGRDAICGFVEDLERSGQFDALLEKIKAKSSDVPAESEQLWAQYVGVGADPGLHQQISYDFIKGIITVTTPQGMYRFLPAAWTWTKIDHQVREMDTAIQFVKDFLGRGQELVLDVTLYPQKETGTNFTWPNGKITLIEAFDYGPYSCAHEATHAIDFLTKKMNASAFLVEGLAELVSAQCSITYGDAEYQALKQWSEKDTLYQDRMRKSGRSPNEFDYRVYTDGSAMMQYKDGGPSSVYSAKSLLKKQSSAQAGHLYSYAELSSFFQYLYHEYGKQSILAAYEDNVSWEKSFGKSLDALLADWRAYLGLLR